MLDLRLRPLCAVLVPLALGCGGAPPKAIVTGEFTEAHAEIFEDGIDFIEDPTTLEGRWREQWSDDLDRRVSMADVISLVRVKYVRTDTDLNRTNTYRIVTEPQRDLYGEAPQELALMASEGEPGFSTVEGNEQRILDRAFVAFVKWYRVDEATIRPRWHLAPATAAVVQRAEFLIERHHDVNPRGRRTVIVHEN